MFKRNNWLRAWVMAIVVLALITSFSVPVMAQDEPGEDEVVIVWATFWVGTNPLKPWGEILVEEFNEMYDGQYHIVTEEIPGDEQYRDKLRAAAAADALPDLITGNITLMRDMWQSGKVVNLSPYLEADPEWRDKFVDDAFDYYTAEDDNIYAVPYSKDYVGIYYNTALFEEAGVEEFPTTWDEFFAASEKLKEAGITPFAMEGDWVTRLMWANMIGTQPGGEAWLKSQDPDRQFSGVEPVIAGTEMLREYHQLGYVNEDAYTTMYSTAATLFLQADAAMIANGPWMINQISGLTAETAEGLYENVKYAPSPGVEEPGIIVITGEAGFTVGAKDPEVIEGCVKFLKFLLSDEQMINQLLLVSRPGATKLEIPDDVAEEIDPMALNIFEKGAALDNQYPHTGLAMSNEVIEEFKNLWPSYVQGDLSTEEFLQWLDDADF